MTAPLMKAPLMKATGTLFERLGGEAGVKELVTRFYDEMNQNPDARLVRDKHPADLDPSRQKLFEYFTGWFGGPPLFTDKYGHPRLRARHNHIEIGLRDRDQWLHCLTVALDQMALAPDLRADLLEKIAPMADHMRNLEEEAPLVDC
ncbi:MAG: hemoglobin [Candidatus Azotimanducaceae bacterium]|jgi:hemoglobin